MRTSLPPVRLKIHPSAFDLLMAVLENNATNAVEKNDRDHAIDLMNKRMKYTRIYTNESVPYASLRMYETEASEMIWQLLIAAIGSVEVRKEYSKELIGGETNVPPKRDE